MVCCRLASPRSIGPCRAAGCHAAPCTKSSGQVATKRMARSPPPSPPASSRVSIRTASCCGALAGRIFTVPVLPRMGSIRRGWWWCGPRATPKSCGRWRRGCAHQASPRWWAKSAPCRRWRAADCSLPRNAQASPLLYCGAGVTAGRQRANAICRMPPRRAGASPRCRRSPLPFPPRFPGFCLQPYPLFVLPAEAGMQVQPAQPS
jgi:hypothetical protein